MALMTEKGRQITQFQLLIAINYSFCDYISPIWSNGQGPMTFETLPKVQVVEKYIIVNVPVASSGNLNTDCQTELLRAIVQSNTSTVHSLSDFLTQRWISSQIFWGSKTLRKGSTIVTFSDFILLLNVNTNLSLLIWNIDQPLLVNCEHVSGFFY